MKALLKIIGICLLIVGIVVLVNQSHPASTHRYEENRCTRYCHDHECPHFEQKLQAKNRLAQQINPIYRRTIIGLQQNALGWSYKSINLFIFVFGLPLITAVLLWNLIRK